MSFHKHGVFSFTVAIQRMRLIAGDNFVADVTGLRRHGSSGAVVEQLDVTEIPEQYGDTAQQAQGRAITVMNEWLEGRHTAQRTSLPSSRMTLSARPESDTAPPHS
jgi:O-succinylbenzoate synthase